MITIEDKESIVYFIQEKDDITRWTDWENKKADIEAEYPELIFTLNNIKVQRLILDSIIEKIGDEIVSGL